MLLRHDLKDLILPFKGSDTIETNYSEVFQDIFVLQCLNGKKGGTYLEIGAGDPIKGSNTYLLEKEFEWTGLSIDYGWDDWNEDTLVTVWCDNMVFTRSEFRKYWMGQWSKFRHQPLLLNDAVSCDWVDIINNSTNLKHKVIDYLQVDIDPSENTYKCLERLPFDTVDFKVITYEHDAYDVKDNGKKWRIKSRKFLESKGYILIAGNISKEPNLPFEDWWVNLKYINDINPSIIRNTFEESLPVMKYLFNK